MNAEKPQRSDAYVREHLSNERTFLAWIRTALALMGFGVVIARWRWLVPAPVQSGAINALTLGLALSGLGLATVLFALAHYLTTRRALENNDFRPMGASVVAFGVLIGIVGLGILIYLFNSPVGVAPAPALP